MAETPPAQSRQFPWRVLIIAVLIAFLTVAGLAAWYTYRLFNPPITAKITQEFKEYLPTAGPTDGLLETATCSVPESFTHSESAWLFNVIPLGTNVSEIRVPAIYRYHVDLFSGWKLEARGQVCVVTAPEFNPDLPPAIVTSQMEKSTSAGWLRFDANDDLATLERDITDELNRRADDKVHRNYVREACRHAVARFVKVFLMKEDIWRDDRFHQIVVVFPDDPPATAASDENRTIYTLDGQPAPQ